MNTIRKPHTVKAKVLKACNITPAQEYVPAKPSESNASLMVPAHFKTFPAIKAKVGDVVEVCSETLRNLVKKGVLAPA